jgi:hypothetical protein
MSSDSALGLVHKLLVKVGGCVPLPMVALPMHPEFSSPFFAVCTFLGWIGSKLGLGVPVAVLATPASDRSANLSHCTG